MYKLEYWLISKNLAALGLEMGDSASGKTPLWIDCDPGRSWSIFVCLGGTNRSDRS